MSYINHYFCCIRKMKIRNVVVKQDIESYYTNKNKVNFEDNNDFSFTTADYDDVIKKIKNFVELHEEDKKQDISMNDLSIVDYNKILELNTTDYNKILEQINELVKLDENQILQIGETGANEQLEGIINHFKLSLDFCSNNIKELCDGQFCNEYVNDHDAELGGEIGIMIDIYSSIFNNCLNIIKILSIKEKKSTMDYSYSLSIIVLFNEAMKSVADIICKICDESRIQGDKLLLNSPNNSSIIDSIKLYNSSLGKYSKTIDTLLDEDN